MRTTIYILLFLLSYTAYSQSLSIFNVDASDFPTMKANFFAFDANYDQLTTFSQSDFEVTENGTTRTVIEVSCPNPNPPIALSSVLVMDVSGSMCGNGLNIAKAAAKAWVSMLPLGKSECALTSFSDFNNINQDFTIDRPSLFNAINNLYCLDGTDYNAAMIDPMAGGILVAQDGKYKRVIVFLSDGEPITETKTAQIISDAISNDITIYCVTIGIAAPQCMKDFAEQTGGLYFENIRTKEEAEECYRKILITSQGGDPCRIEWQGGGSCLAGLINLQVKLIPFSLTSSIYYNSKSTSITKLEFSPPYLKFLKSEPGIKKDTTIKITAKNADFNVTNITSTNPSFMVSPQKFTLFAGETKLLKVSYLPPDSGYTFAKIIVENDNCPTKYYVSGGFPGVKPTMQTIVLIHPNGGEVFSAGSDTVITWEGVLPDEQVSLDYSTNNGINWLPIADSVTGLSYKWRVPKTPSNLCLARVRASGGYKPGCPDVVICSKIWMGCNLDVDHYRNGDSIPEVTDPIKWNSLQTGAWCYYNNDPAMGAIYGKLYNWYAVNDIRGLAPDGWHVASDAEWTGLEDCLGGSDEAGRQLKTTGTIEDGDGLWYSPNTGATNETGFSALPSAFRSDKGAFNGIGQDCSWWCATQLDTPDAWLRFVGYDMMNLSKHTSSKKYGYAVRCIRD